MSLKNPEPRPGGTDPLARLMQDLWDAVFGPGAKWISSPTARYNRSEKGRWFDCAPGGGGSSPAGLAAFTFVAAFSEYLACKDAAGTMVRVARPAELRCSVTREKKYGINYTYTYPHNVAGDSLAYIYRVSATDGATPEPQGIVPLWLASSTDGSVGTNAASRLRAGKLEVPETMADDPLDAVTAAGSVCNYELVGAWAWSAFDDPGFGL